MQLLPSFDDGDVYFNKASSILYELRLYIECNIEQEKRTYRNLTRPGVFVTLAIFCYRDVPHFMAARNCGTLAYPGGF